MYGKIISIDIKSKETEIVAMGVRNSQGLYYDQNSDIILFTDHGPKGGDEININFSPDNEVIENYGWPISSYGEEYDGKTREGSPFYKSHVDYGFIEPLKYFTKAIAPSEIVSLGDNRYIMGAMKDKSIYTFEISDRSIVNLKRVEIGERVRDVIFNGKDIYLFLEDTASIGIINYK